ncbi:hypothetical protein [Dankookia sp. P2]|uniref:hypothetical protein n=1 Tax=Dankookia sp. P2 TaxID=3423955 RepID=UPI003D67D4EA
MNPLTSEVTDYACKKIFDPLVLDLTGTGIHTTRLEDSDTHFKVVAGATAQRTAWVAADTGMLVLDANHNGRIDDITELFGNTGGFGNGFANLRSHDTNHDGRITAADAVFAELRVWVDANGDGIASPAELRSLAELGITALNLASSVDGTTDASGNYIALTGSYTLAGGATRAMADVYFSYFASQTEDQRNIAVPADVLSLPDLHGAGQVGTLHNAMALDPALKQLVDAFTQLPDGSSLASLRQAADAIIYRWAGVDGAAAGSRGPNIDARLVDAIERFTGTPVTSPGVDVAPRQVAALQAHFTEVEAWVTARLMLAGPLSALADDFTYTLATDSLDLAKPMAAVMADATAYAGSFGAANVEPWSKVALLLAGYGITHALDPAVLAAEVGAASSGNIGAFAAATMQGLGIQLAADGSLTLTGTLADEVFAPVTGDTQVIGGGGGDTFQFEAGNGHLTITEVDWTAAADNELFLGAGILAADVAVHRNAARDIVLDLGHGDQVTLTKMYGTQHGVQWVFFADGTGWSARQVIDLSTKGSAAAETLYGYSDDEVFDGHGGHDLLVGGGGNDTYVFEAGYGALTINNMAYETTSARGTLDIGGHGPADLWLAHRGADLVITAVGSADSVTLLGWYNKARAQVAEIKAGGELLDAGLDGLVGAMASYAAAHPGFNPASAAAMPADAALQAAIASAWHL